MPNADFTLELSRSDIETIDEAIHRLGELQKGEACLTRGEWRTIEQAELALRIFRSRMLTVIK